METNIETVLKYIWLNKEGQIQFNPIGNGYLAWPGCQDQSHLKNIADACQKFQKLSPAEVDALAEHDIFVLHKIWVQLNQIAFTPKWEEFFLLSKAA